MDDDAAPVLTEPPVDPAERSLVNDLRQMVSDGRTLAEAELAYQKSRAAVAGQGAKSIAGWGALALALVFFALMALIMGLVLGVAALLGPWIATVVCFAGLLLAAGLAGFVALRRWQRLSANLFEKDGQRE